MTFAVGIFDLFTYAVPGVFHVAFLAYLASRLHVVDLGRVTSMPAALLVIVVVVLSYVLGHVTYELWALVDKVLPAKGQTQRTRERFFDRNPRARDRAFADANWALLRTGIAVHDKEAAAHIDRLMSQALMVRNLTLPLAFGFVAALAELAFGGHRLEAGCCAVVLAAGVAGSYAEGRTLMRWAHLRTLETCFWLPDLDATLAPADDV
ncbi:hypothetical protein [Amycolatopsis sp. CA-230715]|uniref:hypothetical protein n=1 Tax=Amycolatopsis sp. CA-230715 TaxID=2745196 RepID=UPI001C037E8F|nr:hypothetical protein [Amycolatopsis sp. CA-230715]QWF79350.1 hypothetical protein HUW46_02758 [Amycolatopsis sp. CA-230715]